MYGDTYNASTNNHWLTRPDKGVRDIGSEWTNVTCNVDVPDLYVNFKSSHAGGVRGYKGRTFVHNWWDLDASGVDYQASTENQLLALGTTAISRVLPTNPLSDLPTAVGELFAEGLPRTLGASFLKNKRVSADEVSGEYLNYSFGLKPFFNDMRAFGKASERAEKLINEYAARSGRLVRRKYEFPVTMSETYTNVSNNNGYIFHFAGLGQATASGFMTPVLGGWPGERVDTTKRRKTQWYKGAFTYHLPGAGKDFSSKLAREEAEMRHLYGGISVDTAWNLLPYSWAADWISNAGDVIHNIAAFARDGLVMPWGYIMETCEIHVDRKVSGAKIGQQVSGYNYTFPPEVHTSYKALFRRRRRATPYGFGLDPSGFTTRQWGILTALGIQKNLH